MRIETEIEALTVGSLRGLLAQAERAGAGNDGEVSFRRHRRGGFMARVEFDDPDGAAALYAQLMTYPSDG